MKLLRAEVGRGWGSRARRDEGSCSYKTSMQPWFCCPSEYNPVPLPTKSLSPNLFSYSYNPNISAAPRLQYLPVGMLHLEHSQLESSVDLLPSPSPAAGRSRSDSHASESAQAAVHRTPKSCVDYSSQSENTLKRCVLRAISSSCHPSLSIYSVMAELTSSELSLMLTHSPFSDPEKHTAQKSCAKASIFRLCDALLLSISCPMLPPWFSCVTTASKEALTLFLEHRISISASTLMLLAQQSLTIFDTLADVHAQTGILPSLIIEQCEEARRSSPFDALPLASLSHIARKGKNKVYC